MQVMRNSRQGRDTILIGHRGHPEVEGTMGQCDGEDAGRIVLVETPQDVESINVDNPEELSYVTQTTLSVDDTKEIIAVLKARFPNIHTPKRDDICYATQNRQDAVKKLVGDCDLLLVIGSQTSSNSNRLREIAEKIGIASYLIDNATQIDHQWLDNKTNIGVTAGASAPEVLVQEVVSTLATLCDANISEVDGVKEDITFAVPKELRQ
jgi:4-hydroxy-3-methylbut-2-enyl diphosphate reductase